MIPFTQIYPNQSVLRKLLWLLILIGQVVSGDAQSLPRQQRGPRPPIDLDKLSSEAFEKNRLSIKFKPVVTNYPGFSPKITVNGWVKFGIPEIDSLCQLYNVKKAERMFGLALDDCEYCPDHQLWGFHLWYNLEFDASNDPRELIKSYTALSRLIEVAEPVYKIQRYSSVVAGKQQGLWDWGKTAFVPDDPRFNDQWYLNNTGQQGGAVGKDISAIPAWEFSKGDPSVIVGVIDGGIDATHPDLAGAMWSGIGYNFVSNNYLLDADEHGTHTAGTVAASANNGIGVSGLAGGDGSMGSGVRLMSLEVFGPASNATDFGAPFVWSADKGAAISQNSWGYSTEGVYQQSILDGIDYFISHGGGSVLKGGLVIFAAGNSNSEAKYYPAYYDQVLSVAATNNRDIRSYYSNYGTWVDISAPGGEQLTGNDPKGILGPVPISINNGYKYLQGTSMACPQVSGAAALVVSKAKGRLSADDLKSVLLTTTDNHYPENAPLYASKLGTGRLNVYRALQTADKIASAPFVNTVSAFVAQLQCPNIQLSWQKNNSADEVLLVYGNNGVFGLPEGNYLPGDTLSGGGRVLYSGKADYFLHSIPRDTAGLVYKIWSKNPEGVYSAGSIVRINTPFSITSFIGTPAFNQIQLQWTRTCHTGDVLVVFSPENNFGVPAKNSQTGDTLIGGGIVVYKGSASSCTHQNPILGINHYRIFVYSGEEYTQFGLQSDVCYGALGGSIHEGFESAVFPPMGWQLWNKNPGSITWEKSPSNGKYATDAAQIRFYSYPSGIGQEDYLVLPNLKTSAADSILVSFDRAYKLYSNSGSISDTLELLMSSDCGKSFQSLWKKGGKDLATGVEVFTGNFIPGDKDWKNERFDIRNHVGNAAEFMLAFRAVNNYGQNLYLDNVDVYLKEVPLRDAAVTAISEPLPMRCSNVISPKLEITNLGKDTLKTVKIYCKLTGPVSYVDSVLYTGKYLPKGSSTTVNFQSVTLPSSGNYKFYAYTDLPNNLNDQWAANDTLSIDMTVFENQSLPLKQDFESNIFPPQQWHLTPSSLAYNWERTTWAAFNSKQAALIRNYRFSGGGFRQELIGPLTNIVPADSLWLSFELAYAYHATIGSTTLSDTLEILVSNDCGVTGTTVYKKWGKDLSTFVSTLPIVSSGVDTLGDIPENSLQWRKERVDLSSWAKIPGKLQVIFRNSGNRGNNLFLDNIEMNDVILPAALKSSGYLISPNPFRNTFYIRHLMPPMKLRSISVWNSEGKIIIKKIYNRSAPSLIPIDLSAFPSGSYQLKLQYEDQLIVRKILKLP